jgi:hypothetical protein
MEMLVALHLLAIAHGHYEVARDAEEALAELWQAHERLLGKDAE